MSVNSSNSSLLPHPLPSSLNFYYFLYKCFNSTAGSFSITAFTITSILFLLPLCILVLYLGHQRWRQQRSGTAMSHSDLFTYHMVVIELMGILGTTLSCCVVLINLPVMMMPSIYLFFTHSSGQMSFHILTCVERYLAVVHPVTYLGLRNASGIRIRNVTIGCVWLMCFAGTGLLSVEDSRFMSISYLCITALILIIISFCSLSVLWVLIRPGPGEVAGGKRQVHQSKLRAFYTIMVILGVLLLRLGGNLLVVSIYVTPAVRESVRCGMTVSGYWFYIPSSLVLPLLFLHRAGKLQCSKNNTESGQGPE